MTYKVTPKVSGFRERTGLTIDQMWKLSSAWCYYRIDHEISYQE